MPVGYRLQPHWKNILYDSFKDEITLSQVFKLKVFFTSNELDYRANAMKNVYPSLYFLNALYI